MIIHQVVSGEEGRDVLESRKTSHFLNFAIFSDILAFYADYQIILEQRPLFSVNILQLWFRHLVLVLNNQCNVEQDFDIFHLGAILGLFRHVIGDMKA